MTVENSRVRYTSDAGGTRYYFCCAGCLARFESNPARYAAASSERT